MGINRISMNIQPCLSNIKTVLGCMLRKSKRTAKQTHKRNKPVGTIRFHFNRFC